MRTAFLAPCLHRKCASLLLVLGLVLSLVHLPAKEEPVLREAVEVQVREGIPNLLNRANASDGGEVRVAYLGGSITAASGWRVQSLEALKERYPVMNWVEINAAIGGTGSDLGVFRVQQDVLNHQPDLLFVEFAVNDGGADPVRIQQAMEGIVRQTWAANAETDIVFVYTLSESGLPELQAGKYSQAATAMEEIADHYGIPTVHLAMEVVAREAAGTLIFKGEAPKEGTSPDPDAAMVFSTDGVHPLRDTGHVLYTEALLRAWEQFESLSNANAAAPHELVAPFRPDHWAAAKLVPLSKDMLEGDWTLLDPGEEGDPLARRFSKFLPQLWRANAPGASLSFSFRGRFVGFFDLLGPDGGLLELQLDDEILRPVKRIDGYGTYHRLSKLQVGRKLDPEVKHQLRVTLQAEAPDKAAILFERNRPDFDKNPEKYEPNLWHVGSIMLIGDLAE